MSLPTDYKARKGTPICTGVLDYFPDALAAVSRLSLKANEKHNPGQKLHWSKGKSADHADCLVRHLLERGKTDEEMDESHTVHVAWRALALLQTEIENNRSVAASIAADITPKLASDLALLKAHVEPSPLPDLGPPLIAPIGPPAEDE